MLKTAAERAPGIKGLLQASARPASVPTPVTAIVMALSIAPLLGAVLVQIDALGQRGTALSLHTLLDAASVTTALAVAILAGARFVVRREPVAGVVGSVLLLSSVLGSLHAWAGIGPAGTVERSVWSWTVVQLFTALSMTAGLALMLPGREGLERKRGAYSLVWGLGAAALVTVSVIWGWSKGLPTVLYPAGRLARPWELPALLLFLAAATWVFPRLHRRLPTILSQAILLAAIPWTLGQFQLCFLSRDLQDGHFLAAHLQGLTAQAVVLLALTLDYAATQKRAAASSSDLLLAQQRLQEESRKVERARLDLTKEHEARQRIEEAQLMLQKAVETASFGVTVTDLDGKIVYVNGADAEMHGYRPAELMGKDARLFGLGDLSVPRGGPPPMRFWDRESVNVRRDGSRFPVRLISDRVTNSDGEPVGLLTICEDISSRREVERIRQDFLSTVSHELRTPLTSIVASLSLLESDELRPGPDRARELSAIAFRNSNRLLKLIDDLLDLQKLKADKMKFHLEPLQVHSLLESAVEEIQSFADSREVTLEMSDRLPGATILADRDRMLQVFANLLSNAIKYSTPHDGSRIEIAVREQGESVCVSVADQGPGIPEDRLSTLFVPFSRVELGPTPREQGTGLGLSIVKRLLEGMNGHITVESRVGVGTTFHVLMPRAEEEETA